MAQARKNYTAKMAFSSSVDQVWKLLNNFGNKQLYAPYMHANLSPDETGGLSGTFAIGTTRFRAVYRPYDVRLTSQDIKIGISLQPQQKGCVAFAVATHGENAPFVATDYDLLQFLYSLKSCAGEIIKDSDLVLNEHQQTQTAATGASAKSGTAASGQQRTEASSADGRKGTVSAGKTSGKTARREEARPAKRRTEGLYPEEKKPKKSKKAVYFWRKVLVLLLALAFILAGIWGVKTVKKLFGGKETSPDTNPSGSRGVTFSNSINMGLGLTQSQIERTFGRPATQKNGVCRYESVNFNAYGVPACVVQVKYVGSIATEITILDTVEGARIGAVQDYEPSYSADMTLSELVEQVGTSPSMVRMYSDENQETTEFHFGHVDPKANMSPVWKGELICIQRTDGTHDVQQGVHFDGQDPLYLSSLKGSKMEEIYDNFDDYLEDYYEFQKCLIMKGHYSRGDIKAILGGMEKISAGETEVYRANSFSLLDDGVTPVWNYTVGVGARGGFVYFFGVNTRNWHKENQLKDVDLRSVGIGMNYNDLLASVGKLPNMVYVDYTYLTLGFGEFYEDAATLYEQFELMAVIDMDTMLVENVYDNSERVIVLE